MILAIYAKTFKFKTKEYLIFAILRTIYFYVVFEPFKTVLNMYVVTEEGKKIFYFFQGQIFFNIFAVQSHVSNSRFVLFFFLIMTEIVKNHFVLIFFNSIKNHNIYIFSLSFKHILVHNFDLIFVFYDG